ncbi:tryptophan-rich sensory protein [Patescibacteria group bacterium]|nr:tryptophan-rich sensory protein [Patescibacteria group bacterium]
MKFDFKKLFISLLLPQLTGLVGSFWTAPAITLWYGTLNKPSFSPPNSIFAPVWITLYLMIGLSLYLVWQKIDLKPRKVKLALKIFWVHLILNGLWSIIFFGGNNILWGLYTIIALWLLILTLIIIFWKISKPASLLLVPYFLWVSFATILNYSLLILN